MFRCDYHVHSHYSFDAVPEGSVEAICEAALQKGITDLAITDHFECNAKAETFPISYRADAAFEEIQAAKKAYKNKLHLTYGIEIGQANQYPQEANALLAARDYEFVIGSIHNLTGAPDFYFMDFAKLADMPFYIGHLFDRYITELCAVIDTLPKMDSLAHLTYIQRYCAMAGVPCDLTSHFHKIEALYRKLIAKEIALEVNLSTLWKGLGFSMPDQDLLTLYRDCGGTLVTVGTDAHAPAQVGACIDEGYTLLKKIGLTDILVVREGKKESIKL